MQHLVIGHSHEDVDAAFATISNFLQEQRELPDPYAFASALRRLLEDSSFRPHESTVRSVQLIDSVREWPPSSLFG